MRVNSQSGKGGVAYIMKAEHGLDLPRRLQIEFSRSIQTITEDTGTDIAPADIWANFEQRVPPRDQRLRTREPRDDSDDKVTAITAQLLVDGEHKTVQGQGNGPIAAFVHALQTDLDVDVEVTDYAEHAVSAGAEATAVAYVEARNERGHPLGRRHGPVDPRRVVQGGARRRQPPRSHRLTGLHTVE